jgi:hypothetical protein
MKNKLLLLPLSIVASLLLTSTVSAVDFVTEIEPDPVDVHKDFAIFAHTSGVEDFYDSVDEILGHHNLTFQLKNLDTEEVLYVSDLDAETELFVVSNIGHDGINIKLEIDHDKEPSEKRLYVPGGHYRFELGNMEAGVFTNVITSEDFRVDFEPHFVVPSVDSLSPGEIIYLNVQDINGEAIHLYEGWGIFVSHFEPFYNYGSTVNGSVEWIEYDPEEGVIPGTYKFVVPAELGTYRVTLRLPEAEDDVSFTTFEVVDPAAEEVEEEEAEEEEAEEEEAEEEEEKEEVEEEVEVEEDLPNPFVDTKDHWSANYVAKLYEEGVVSGYDATHFGPDNQITRAEFTKLAVTTFNLPMPDLSSLSDVSFNDVPAPAWYLQYLVAAKDAGIIGGYQDGSFRPEAPVNRAEAITILLKAAGVDPEQSFETVFPDVAPLVWYGKFVNYAAENEIIGGYADGTFGPGNNLSRAEAAKLFSLVGDL